MAKTGKMSVTKPKTDLVSAQSLNTHITLQAEELLDIMDSVHIDTGLYACADFKYS